VTGIVRDVRAGSIRVWVWGSVVLLCLLAVAFGWLGTRVATAAEGLSEVAGAVPALSAAAQSGDLPGLERELSRVHADTRAAAQAVADPFWAVAEAMPVFGDDFAAVASVAGSGDAVVSQMAPLARIAMSLGRPAGDDAMIDVAALAAAHAPISRAAEALAAARADLAGIDTTTLLQPIARGVIALRDAVDAGDPVMSALADATVVLPGILGADGPRTVLVMIQNNAEPRTGGGVTGSFALLTADGGRLALAEQADSSEFIPVNAPVLDVPAPASRLYGDAIGRYVQNVSMSTDFTLTAALASHWWQQRGGTAPDAVMSIDPIVVQALLGVTGPVPLTDGSSLTADNLVQRLLVEPYLTMKEDEQTVFLQSATEAFFQQVITGGIDAMAWTRSLAEPLAAGRVSLWSAHAAEQEVLAGTALAGPAARQQAAGDDAFAVYFNDATGGKMGSFLHVDIATGVAVCRADGRPEVEVQLTMRSSAPPDAAQVLPISISGGGMWGTPWGDIATNVSVAAPSGWFIGTVRRDGEPEPAVDAVEGGFPTSLARMNLSPGDVSTLAFRFIAPEPREVSPSVLHTPMLHEPQVTAGLAVECG